MSEDKTLFIPDEFPPDLILKLVLNVFQAHYKRKLDKMNDILDNLNGLNARDLQRIWGELKAKCQSHQQAFTLFTQWIEGSIDGKPLPIED